MYFNSLIFFLFLPIVFSCYWLLQKASLKYQNVLLLCVSYIFYGWWDVQFLLLIVASTLLDFVIGNAMARSESQQVRKRLKLGSVFFNLGLLGIFKYYDFFASSLQTSLNSFGYELNTFTLDIILPVGISFYTFQTLSYTLDVYNRKIEPTQNLVGFACFVAFFPQLVAGPIERAIRLLPQMLAKRKFCYENARRGVDLIIWGLFQKIAIADSFAPAVEEIFSNYESYDSPTLLLGAIYFSFQIYGDFSGYSNIARGVAKLLGFELMVNFRFPYFSESVSEFWKRWHISLSTWFRDYVFIPLGGSRNRRLITNRNIFIVFVLSGIWHGANWTFLIWGVLHAGFYLIEKYFSKSNRQSFLEKGDWIPSLMSFTRICFTFLLVTLAWVFFRAESIEHAFGYLQQLFSFSLEGKQVFMNPYDNQSLLKENILLALFICAEYLMITGKQTVFLRNSVVRVIINILLLFLTLIYLRVDSELSFIYFQF